MSDVVEVAPRQHSGWQRDHEWECAVLQQFAVWPQDVERPACFRRNSLAAMVIPPPATACGWCGESLERSGPGQPRKFCSTRCRKRAEDVGTCSCGARKSKRARNCASCSAREAKQRLFAPLYARIERMWADGLTLRQMAQELGWKPRSVGPFISEARTSGRLNLPYRRSPEAVAAIRAGQARRRAERETLQAGVPSGG